MFFVVDVRSNLSRLLKKCLALCFGSYFPVLDDEQEVAMHGEYQTSGELFSYVS